MVKSRKIAAVLVIDGLGIGAMDDIATGSRLSDCSANTLRSIERIYRSTFLDELGFYDTMHATNFRVGDKNLRIGRCSLDYVGADSFLGHSYMIGNRIVYDGPHYVSEYWESIKDVFSPRFDTRFEFGIISLDGRIFIANNIESDPGNIINAVGSLDQVSFDDVVSVGETVAKVIRPLRTIAMAGSPLDRSGIYSNITSVRDGSGVDIVGIDIPKTGIYNERYRVLHIGRDTSESGHLLDSLRGQHFSVALLGKCADFFGRHGDFSLSHVDTAVILDALKESFQERKYSFVFANIQEIDLAGHSRDLSLCERVLRVLDDRLPGVLRSMERDDVLIITADHGNDPCIGHGKHTREYVPIAVIGSNGMSGLNFGTRTPLSDIGATVEDFFDIPISLGQSLLKKERV